MRHRERRIFFATTGVALTILGLGLSLPAFQMDQLAASPKAYSIIEGGVLLLRGDQPWLGVLVLAFSAAFPLAKLLGVLRVLYTMPKDVGPAVRWLEWLGKWSMLDVFVVATLIGAAQLGVLSQISARPGIYWFLLAVIASITITVVLGYRLGLPQRPEMPAGSGRRWSGTMLTLTSLILFLVSLNLPLMEVQKWLFWSQDLTLAHTPLRLREEGEAGLALTVAAFVIVLPILRLLCLTVARVRARSVAVVFAYHLDKWSMLDVYALALMVFAVKVGSFAEVELRIGFHLLAVAIMLSVVDGILFRHALRFSPDPSSQQERRE